MQFVFVVSFLPLLEALMQEVLCLRIISHVVMTTFVNRIGGQESTAFVSTSTGREVSTSVGDCEEFRFLDEASCCVELLDALTRSATKKTVNISSNCRSEVLQEQGISVLFFSALHSALLHIGEKGAVGMVRLSLADFSVLNPLSPSAGGHSFPPGPFLQLYVFLTD